MKLLLILAALLTSCAPSCPPPDGPDMGAAWDAKFEEIEQFQ